MNHHRIKYLDGLRGLMALNVIIFHFVIIYYPQMYSVGSFEEFTEKLNGADPEVLWLFASTGLNSLINGNVAVSFFFVLSGFFAALTIFNFRRVNLLKIALKRYLRLLPVVAVSTILTWILMRADLLYNQHIADYVVNTGYCRSFCNFYPGFLSLLYNIFVRPFIFGSDYVVPFWTIRFEIFCYLICVAVVALVGRQRWRRLAYFLICCILFVTGHSIFLAFISGVLLCDLMHYDATDTTWLSKYYTAIIRQRSLLYPMMLMGLFFASFPMSETGIYAQFPPIGNATYRTLGISLTLWAIINLPWTHSFLNSSPVQWMGRISYSTYGLHLPIMLSVQDFIFMNIHEHMPYNLAAITAFVATLPVIYIISYFSWRYIENPLKPKSLFPNIC